MSYVIKGIKNFKGHEGEPCAEGNLYKGPKKVAEWSDDSWGGPMQVNFVNADEEAAFLPFAKDYLAKQVDFEGQPYNLDEMSKEAIVDTAIEQMSYAAAEDASLRKLCKDKIAFTLKTAKGKETFTLKALYCEKQVAKIRAHHPDLVEIINERYGPAPKEGTPEYTAAETEYYRKDCKKYTVYIRMKDGARATFIRKVAFSAAVAASLRKTVPDLLEIMNERYA